MSLFNKAMNNRVKIIDKEAKYMVRKVKSEIKERVRSGNLNFVVSGNFSYNHILDIDMKQEVYRKACKILKEHYKTEDIFISEYYIYAFDGVNIINGFKVIIQKRSANYEQ